MAVTYTRSNQSKSQWRVWRTPVCAGAIVGTGASALVVWTEVTPVGVLSAAGFVLAGFFLTALLDRGIRTAREKRRG